MLRPFHHYHEDNPAFFPTANPADAPAIYTIPESRGLEQPKELGLDFHGTHQWLWRAGQSRFELADKSPAENALLLDGSKGHNDTRRTITVIQHISAVTFAVRDMARSIEFYEKLGFELVYGGERAVFSSLKAGEAFVNLAATPEYEHQWWGRAIFRVDDVDTHHRLLQARGLLPELPRDGPWGERFFHLSDLDGHELSFAALLPTRC